ncbi:MAG: tagatose 1,6-diphosphate aldolase [Anaerolineaceae bacterium]|nr:tagatose 1,6-diphosphate aldolase [Anaerolineaceae bacterium]
MKPLTIGKYRGLQRCSTQLGSLAVLALDHRNNLRNALNPEDPASIDGEQMSAFKRQVIRAIAPAASAALLDPEVGAAQCIASGDFPSRTGLVIAVEATGYTGDPNERRSQVLPGWSVAKARRMGADAVKLLVYYHPQSPTAHEIEDLTARVAEDCRREDILFMLEPLSYPLDPTQKKVTGMEKYEVVVETARRLTPLGADVLKAEFPYDINLSSDEQDWTKACADLSAASPCPWIVLSAAVNYETYLRQVVAACDAGASGVAVGRAVWKEAPNLKGADRDNFLKFVAYQRMAKLTALCDAHAVPWTKFYQPEAVDENWYQRY